LSLLLGRIARRGVRRVMAVGGVVLQGFHGMVSPALVGLLMAVGSSYRCHDEKVAG
jgi:hypothetical protein